MFRRNSSRAITALALLALLTLYPGTAWTADTAAGKEVFAAKCKTCHGADGAGNPAMAKALKVEFKHLGSPEIQKKSDADLKKTISSGTGKMKAVSGLSAGEIDKVIAYVRTIKK